MLHCPLSRLHAKFNLDRDKAGPVNPKSVFYGLALFMTGAKVIVSGGKSGVLPVAPGHNSPVNSSNKPRMIKDPGVPNLTVGQLAPT